MTSSAVLGVGASHSTLMNTHWDEVVHRESAEAFRDALGEARDAIAAAGADVAVVIGSNHFRGFWLDLLPAFTIGVGEVVASGESGTPEGPQRTDPDFARHLLNEVVAEDFDVAFSLRLQIDHGISHAIQYVLAGLDIPVVPIVVNVFAPPLPSLRRCVALGAALGRAIASFPGDRRVAVIASGGLSHQLPWPDWRAPKSDDESFMVDAWLNGRDKWAEYDPRRRQIVLGARPDLNDSFDHEVLDLVAAGRAAELTAYEGRLAETAGNGANEIRTWLMMTAAVGDGPGRTLSYAPMPEWLTGMAVSLVEPAPSPHPTGAPRA